MLVCLQIISFSSFIISRIGYCGQKPQNDWWTLKETLEGKVHRLVTESVTFCRLPEIGANSNPLLLNFVLVFKEGTGDLYLITNWLFIHSHGYIPGSRPRLMHAMPRYETAPKPAAKLTPLPASGWMTCSPQVHWCLVICTLTFDLYRNKQFTIKTSYMLSTAPLVSQYWARCLAPQRPSDAARLKRLLPDVGEKTNKQTNKNN